MQTGITNGHGVGIGLQRVSYCGELSSGILSQFGSRYLCFEWSLTFGQSRVREQGSWTMAVGVRRRGQTCVAKDGQQLGGGRRIHSANASTHSAHVRVNKNLQTQVMTRTKGDSKGGGGGGQRRRCTLGTYIRD